MPLELMYITNRPEVAQIAENSGIDRIFVDLEYIGKDIRQGGMDTVQNRHTISDVDAMKKALTKASLLVRVNPIHDATNDYSSTEQEIEDVINAGAQIIMLPFFKTAKEVERFIKAVNGRTKTQLLIETPEAIENIDEILSVGGIDEVFIGLNDLSLGYGHKFMFKPLADGTVEKAIEKFKKVGVPYGFGGIAALGRGALPSEKIIGEHYRLGSTRVILSRSFCNTNIIEDINVIKMVFETGVSQIREYEQYCMAQSDEFFSSNREDVIKIVDELMK